MSELRETIPGEQPSVLAVLVTFNPDLSSLEQTLASILPQVQKVVIVDNDSANLEEIKQLAALLTGNLQGRGIDVFAQNKNLGLGAAHNIGFKYAAASGYEYTLILDQDSIPAKELVVQLLMANSTKSHLKVSAVGARYLNSENGSASFFVRFGALKFRRQYCHDQDGDACIKADFLISSGSLFSTDAINDIGYMDEGLFIDHVDTEWFLRAKSKGYQCFGACGAVMQHGLGEKTHRLNIGRQRNVPQHKPFRYYYIFRNSLILYRRKYTSWLWRWNDCQRLLLIVLMFGVWKSPRAENLKMMMRGLRDGWRGISGEMQ